MRATASGSRSAAGAMRTTCPSAARSIPRLSALAYAMQQRFGGSDGKQVMVALDDALALLDHPRAEDLLKAGEQLTVLDEERRTDQVRFFHQLLQEYFAARHWRTAGRCRQPGAKRVARGSHSPSLAEKLATLQDFEPLPLPDPHRLGGDGRPGRRHGPRPRRVRAQRDRREPAPGGALRDGVESDGARRSGIRSRTCSAACWRA